MSKSLSLPHLADLRPELLTALRSLVYWHDLRAHRHRGASCTCRACPVCRGRRCLQREAAPVRTVADALLALARCTEAQIGRCNPKAFCACRVCVARIALRKLGQAKHGTAVTGQINLRRDARKAGGQCAHGHALTPENTYHERNRAGAQIDRCRTCRTDRRRAYDIRHPEKRHIRPRKRIPGYCTYGIHLLTPETTMIRSNGSKGCRICNRARDREWARKKRQKQKKGKP